MQLISFFFPSFSFFMLSRLVLRPVLGVGEESVVSPGSVSLSLSLLFYLFFYLDFFFFFFILGIHLFLCLSFAFQQGIGQR